MEITLIKDGTLKISELSATEKMRATHTRETGREIFKCCFSYVHRDHEVYLRRGRGAQDDHLDFYTAPELCQSNVCFSAALRPQKPSGLFGTGSPGRPSRISLTQLLSSAAPEQCRASLSRPPPKHTLIVMSLWWRPQSNSSDGRSRHQSRPSVGINKPRGFCGRNAP